MLELFGVESCIDAATFIPYAIVHKDGRVQNCKGGSIEDLFYRFNGLPRLGSGKYQRSQTIGSHFVTSCVDGANRILRSRIRDVVQTGLKACYRVRTVGGEEIIATLNHKFFNGVAYVPLLALGSGSTVYVHRNVPFTKPKPKRVVHHINKNRLDNRINNLEVTTSTQHNLQHYLEDGGDSNLRFIAVPTRIDSIEAVGARMTYDIKMEDPWHNFVANRFVVHNSGKSTLAAFIAKFFQAEKRCVLYLDYEHAVDLAYFRKIGLNTQDENLWLYDQPYSLEDGVDAATSLIKTGKIGLLIVDSVAAMAPEAELEGTAHDQQIGLQARLMGKTLRILVGLLEKTGTTALFINQLRDKIGGYIPMSTTPGGRALKFHASVRVELRRQSNKPEDSGFFLHRAMVRKQKTTMYQSTMVDFLIGANGIECAQSLLLSLLHTGVMTVKGTTYFFGNRVLGKGEEHIASAIMGDKLLRSELESKLFEVWRDNG